ncbi:NADH-ubiquinone oxidoreductase chain J [hydrothermal vent metagenome]|uniref:NADH-ubiquinone oxidoreductase chain J n=1 Tax=hydrothermal vent metagenome TaxID=652676 RepID=A0A3B1A826_9ZZZZ
MTGVQILFYAFATMMLLSALMVITVRNPVRSALFLVLTFVSSSALWLIMQAEFLAIVLVLVYVGAVMVLFLFVVMMLDVNLTRLKEGFISYLPVGLGIAGLFGGMLTYLLYHMKATDVQTKMRSLYPPAAKPADYSNTEEIGLVLYTDYVYPFEIASVILLVAIVAAIALTFRRRSNRKYQNPDEQVAVKRDDRIRIVKMDTEEKR